MRLKQLESAIATTEHELGKVQASAAGLQACAAELQASMDDAGGEPLKAKRALVAKLQEVVALTARDCACSVVLGPWLF